MNYCMECMAKIHSEEKMCPHCGKDNTKIQHPEYALPLRTILHGQYLTGRILGQGGFGITYIGYDLVLDRKVAIKEYYPASCVTRSHNYSLIWSGGTKDRDEGCNLFLKEARKLAKIEKISNVVKVQNMFMENQTAYIIMDYVEGKTLKQLIKQNGVMSWDSCIKLLLPIMDALEKIHSQGLIHRDIKPDNIMISSNGIPVLLDLGAAKGAGKTGEYTNSTSLVATHGFSPLEQYSEDGKIGPWTDIYALCATIYYCILGKKLPDAMTRAVAESEGKRLEIPKNLMQAEWNVLNKGLSIYQKNRYQNIAELKKAIAFKISSTTVKSNSSQKKQEKPIEKTPKPKGKNKFIKWSGLIVILFIVRMVVSTAVSNFLDDTSTQLLENSYEIPTIAPVEVPVEENIQIQEQAKTEKTPKGIIVNYTDELYYITTANLNIRTDAGAESTAIGTIPKNTSIIVVGTCENGWLKVKYNNMEGYVSSSYVKIDESKQIESQKADTEIEEAPISAWENAKSGALYKNGILTYGPASIAIGSGYTEVTVENDTGTYIISSDQNNYYYVKRVLEIMEISYDNSTQEEILESYVNSEGFSNPSMINFDKFYIGEYPCVSYGIKVDVNGIEEYISELIIFKDKMTKETLRILSEAITKDAYQVVQKSIKEGTLCTNPEKRDVINGYTHITIE